MRPGQHLRCVFLAIQTTSQLPTCRCRDIQALARIAQVATKTGQHGNLPREETILKIGFPFATGIRRLNAPLVIRLASDRAIRRTSALPVTRQTRRAPTARYQGTAALGPIAKVVTRTEAGFLHKATLRIASQSVVVTTIRAPTVITPVWAQAQEDKIQIASVVTPGTIRDRAWPIHTAMWGDTMTTAHRTSAWTVTPMVVTRFPSNQKIDLTQLSSA